MACEFSVKPLLAEYEAFLWEMLYNNIFVARESELADRDMSDLPTLKKYMEGWGEQANDVGFIALSPDNQPIGAVWSRLFTADDDTWGYIDEQTPELCIATVESARGCGVGTALLKQMLNQLSQQYDRVSLSVHPSNRSISLYRRHGFEIAETYDNALTMVRKLN